MRSPDGTQSAASAAQLREIEQFLYHEAFLLDRHRFEEWLSLFTDDAVYWVPLEEDQADAAECSSIIHDDRALLELRVGQFREARAHARLPLPRTCHQVSNVLLLEKAESSGELIVNSALVLIVYRRERQRVFGASVEHRLRRTPGGLRIARKRIDLVNSEAELEGIAFLL